MYVAGADPARTPARAGLVTWKRSASVANEGMPSTRVTTSPSRSMSSYSFARPAQLGEGNRDVALGAAGQAHGGVADVGNDAHTVPLDLVHPLGTGRHPAAGVASMGRMGPFLFSCEPSGKARSPSDSSTCRSASSRRPRTTTCSSARSTRRTAGASATNASAPSTARRWPTPTSPRAYEAADGQMVVLSDEDMKSLPVAVDQGDLDREVRALRADRPAAARQVLLPRARQDRPQALRAAARRPREGRPDGTRHGVSALAHDAGRAACARRRHRAADAALGGRGARPGVRVALRGDPRDEQGARDGILARRLPLGRLRARRVRGRLRRGRRGRSSRARSRAATSRRRPRPRARRPRSSTCWRPCNAASTRPRPPSRAARALAPNADADADTRTATPRRRRRPPRRPRAPRSRRRRSPRPRRQPPRRRFETGPAL